MLDLNPDGVSVDVQRDQGFLEGFGIDVGDKTKIGDENDPRIVGHDVTDGAEEGGRTAMENLLQKDPTINLVYTINEPAAAGAYEALKAAGKEKDVTIVSVDGGCPGVENVKKGVIGATSQQYPLKMAEMGVQAVVAFAKDGTKPEPTGGQGLRRHRRDADHRQAGRRRRVQGHGVRPRELLGLDTHVQSLPQARYRRRRRRRRDRRGRRPRARGDARQPHPRHPAHERDVRAAVRPAARGRLLQPHRRPFLAPGNLSLIVQQVMVVGTLGIAQTLVILTAGIDLSVGAIMVLSSIVMAKLGTDQGLPGLLALAARVRRRHGLRPASTVCSSPGCGCRRSSSPWAR